MTLALSRLDKLESNTGECEGFWFTDFDLRGSDWLNAKFVESLREMGRVDAFHVVEGASASSVPAQCLTGKLFV